MNQPSGEDYGAAIEEAERAVLIEGELFADVVTYVLGNDSRYRDACIEAWMEEVNPFEVDHDVSVVVTTPSGRTITESELELYVRRDEE